MKSFLLLSTCLATLAVAACGGEAPASVAPTPDQIPSAGIGGPQSAEVAGPAADAAIDPSAPMTGASLLQRVQQTYAGLKTYSDTATIATAMALPGNPDLLRGSHTFSTKYTAPRQFKFDFRGGEGDRLVIWSSGGPFSTWWKATGVTEEYPQGEGATAFATAQTPTSGGALMIPTLLFPGAALEGPLANIKDPELLDPETLDGRQMYRIKADVRVNHWSEGTRPTTVWIDAETLLVRKVLEERPSTTDLTDTITTTITPQANIDIPATEYQFTAPKT